MQINGCGVVMKTDPVGQANRFLQDSRLPKVLSILLALAILYVIVSSVFFQRTAATISPAGQSEVSQGAVTNLASLHLFGQYRESASNLPLTSLPLLLNGTEMSVQTGQKSFALITSRGSSKTTVYAVGDIVPGGAVIKQILKQSVVLDNNGNLEQLQMIVPILQNQEEGSS